MSLASRPPFSLDPPQEAAVEETRALEGLGRALGEACPDPRLSSGFLQRLLAERTPVWSFRDALRRNPALRVAAGLLILVTSSVPVVAAVVLLQDWTADEGTEIVFELPRIEDEAAVEESDPAETLEPTPIPDAEELLGSGDEALETWMLAMHCRNRLALASAAWRAAHPDLPSGDPEPPSLDWSTASAEQLDRELERRLTTGDDRMIPPALIQRVQWLWDRSEESAMERELLRGWIEILRP